MTTPDIHAGREVLHRGPAVGDARLAVIALHGRGASAEDILLLAGQVGTTDVAWLAPQAAGHSWYPLSFLSPLADNEPALSSALRRIETLLAEVDAAGVPADRTVLLGFSQGACLSLEFAARHPRRYGAVVALSGGLIGPPGTPFAYDGWLDETPVFVGCSDVDPHIPAERVRESAEIFRRLGAAVDARIYPGMGHTVNRDEVDRIASLLAT